MCLMQSVTNCVELMLLREYKPRAFNHTNSEFDLQAKHARMQTAIIR